MDADQEMGVMFAIMAMRNALLTKGVLSQPEIDQAVGEIFARMALDKALGANLSLLNSLDAAKVEHWVRTILHPGYREEPS